MIKRTYLKKCPKCNSTDIKNVLPRMVTETFPRDAMYIPFKCNGCSYRWDETKNGIREYHLPNIEKQLTKAIDYEKN